MCAELDFCYYMKKRSSFSTDEKEFGNILGFDAYITFVIIFQQGKPEIATI